MSDDTKIIPATEPADSYTETLEELKARIRGAQYKALRSVNQELITLYWYIGQTIVDRQEKYQWGDKIVTRLAKDIQVEFPGTKGFSISNLWRMRTLYLTYKGNEKLAQLVRQIGWSHNVLILERCKNDVEREFYLKTVIYRGWGRENLADAIRGNAFERWALSQTNFDITLPEDQRAKAVLAVKDDYDFSFLDIEEPHNERKLEATLVSNITKFLAEMGGWFTFVGRQYRVDFEDKEYFIDLLFFHRVLKCLVAIELKTVAFQPEHVGKMQFYLSALDATARVPGENPSVGIIVCKEKSRVMVEYTLKDVHRPIGVATYNSYSRLKDIPAEIAKYLPSEEEIKKRLGGVILLEAGKKPEGE